MNISKWNYMDGYSSSNYGAHTIAIKVGELTLFFSYDTVIKFIAPGFGACVSENIWGPTTGKHLNALSADKQDRLQRGEFEKKLEECLKRYDLNII